jgi:hypothetical protein
METHGTSAACALEEDQLRDLLCRVGGVVGLLQDPDADERRQFCQQPVLNHAYQRVSGKEK